MDGKIKKYVNILKQNNIRMTSQRYAILEYLAIDGIHPTANEVYENLKEEFPSMSVATVYNNLNFFKEAGIVKEVPFGENSTRFDLTDTTHYHAVCNRCGKVVDFNYPELLEVEKIVEKMTAFKVDNHQFKITGLCSECQKIN